MSDDPLTLPTHGGAHGEPDDSATLRELMHTLFAMLSHDLRTPLSAISGWLFLLESDKLDPVARKRALAKIRGNVDEQVQMIDDALLLSCCETGHLELNPAPLSPFAILAESLGAAALAATAAGVALQGPAERDDTLVRADAERLRRVFDLLLARAIKGTPSGGVVTTTSSTRARPGFFTISVADTGKGIAAEALPHLLDPLARPGDGGRGRGVDRRLLLANALTIAHGGRLIAASDGDGQGSTFTVEIPVG